MEIYVIAIAHGFWYEETCSGMWLEKAFKTEEEAERYVREHESELENPEGECDYQKYQILPVTIED